jgi:CheY-like chemotaxis protein
MYTATILIVDDSNDIRMMLQHLLTCAGYHTIEAANGQEAVRLARQYRPALVLLDLNLPALDGWEVARRIRAEPALDETLLMAMTGYCYGSATQAALDAGCASVLLKPLNFEQLTNQIETHLHARSTTAEKAYQKAVGAPDYYTMTHAA